MLRQLNDAMGYVLAASDGDIGRCVDFLIDDGPCTCKGEQVWAVRYMIADTGRWLADRKVLVSPTFLGEADWRKQRLEVKLTRDVIRDAPFLENEQSVSRRYEAAWHRHHGLPDYWKGTLLTVPTIEPEVLQTVEYACADRLDASRLEAEELDRSAIRSAAEIVGCSVRSADGPLGTVADAILDDRFWVLRFLAVEPGQWMPAPQEFVPQQRLKHMAPVNRLQSIDWDAREFRIDLPAKSIQEAPLLNPDDAIDIDFETRLHEHFGRPADLAAG
jgi:hypothetical protein